MRIEFPEAFGIMKVDISEKEKRTQDGGGTEDEKNLESVAGGQHDA